MVHVDVQFNSASQVDFTARGRQLTNNRQPAADGPVGFTSMELLLIALGNCAIGTLLSQEPLRTTTVRSVTASIDGEMAHEPTRLRRIEMSVELTIDDASVLDHHSALEAATEHCPVGNTLRGAVEVATTLRLKAEPTDGSPAGD